MGGVQQVMMVIVDLPAPEAAHDGCVLARRDRQVDAAQDIAGHADQAPG